MVPIAGSHLPMTGADTSAADSTRVSFKFHPRVLAALGRDLVTDDVVAVMELVKNSYDALAAHVEIQIRTSESGSDSGRPCIEIVDDGYGMDRDTIENAWCVIATPCKQEQPIATIGKRSRPVTGEKGLGRLSAARLGKQIDVVTRTSGGPILGFSLNWEELVDSDDLGNAAFDVSHLRAESFDGEHGTRIRIGALRSVWNEEKIENLRESLARLVSPFAAMKDFSLRLDAPGGLVEPSVRDIRPPEFMAKPKYAIEGNVDGEGNIRAQYQYRPINGSPGRDRKICEHWAASHDASAPAIFSGLNGSGPDCGPFRFEVRAWDLTKDDTREIADHFRESQRDVRRAITSQHGISVYRDDILVLPKPDGTRDWLGLDRRRISRVGSRLSTSQVVGCVRITKSENSKIVDTSNREGLVENPSMVAFRELVTRIVNLLEQQRDIDRMDSREAAPARDLFATLNPEPLVEKIERLRDTGGSVDDVLKEVKDFGEKLDKSRAVI